GGGLAAARLCDALDYERFLATPLLLPFQLEAALGEAVAAARARRPASRAAWRGAAPSRCAAALARLVAACRGGARAGDEASSPAASLHRYTYAVLAVRSQLATRRRLLEYRLDAAALDALEARLGDALERARAPAGDAVGVA